MTDLGDRTKYIGGSDIGAVLGISPWTSKRELWLEKKGLGEPVEVNSDMKRGTVLEPVAAEQYKQQTGRKVRISNKTYQHKDFDFLRAHIDRQIVAIDDRGPGVLEIKCPGVYSLKQTEREGIAPNYVVQLQHYLGVTGYKWGAFCLFNAENWTTISFDVNRDDALIEQIEIACGAFWMSLHEKDCPYAEEEPATQVDIEPVGAQRVLHDKSSEFMVIMANLKRLYPNKKLEPIAWEAAKALALPYLDEWEFIQNELGRLSYLWQAKTSIDKKQMEKDGVLMKYTKTSKFRGFRPTFFNKE